MTVYSNHHNILDSRNPVQGHKDKESNPLCLPQRVWLAKPMRKAEGGGKGDSFPLHQQTGRRPAES